MNDCRFFLLAVLAFCDTTDVFAPIGGSVTLCMLSTPRGVTLVIDVSAAVKDML